MTIKDLAALIKIKLSFIQTLNIDDQILFYTALFAAFSVFISTVSTILNFFLWRNAVRQTRQSLMPFLAIYVRKKEKTGDEYLAIRNLGYGAALNISLEDWHLYLRDTDEIIKTRFSVGIPNVLKVDEERRLTLQSKIGDRDISIDFMTFYLQFERAEKVPLLIIFQDLSGIRYVQKIYAGKGMLRIKGPPVRSERLLRQASYMTLFSVFKLRILYWRKRKRILRFLKNLIET